MKRTRFWLVVVVLITFAAMAAPAKEVHINATAVTESGSQLAKGTYRVVTTKEELKRVSRSSGGIPRYWPKINDFCGG